jgi:transposase-like protein
MRRLSIEAKEAIVLKAQNRGTETLRSFAKSNNVGYSSLKHWARNYREGKPLLAKRPFVGSKHARISEERFNHLIATAELDEVSLGAYCREHGLYSHQLTEWRESFMSNQHQKKISSNQSELNALKAENKRLHQELRRKDSVLAEAAALLIMKKKADLIWGESEDV